MKIRIILIILAILTAQFVYAQQARFTTQGIIEYEKKVNSYAILAERIKKYSKNPSDIKELEDYKKTNPQFKTLKSKLVFNQNSSLFTPIVEGVINSDWVGLPAAQQHNTIYTNINEDINIIEKKVFEEVYLMKDSTRKINWKITSETREIAGFTCRRANALIMDSIYVVAFYTDKIPVSVGPERFSGLPGMILGVALPWDHITWFATSVSDQPVTAAQLKAPTKGKPIDNKSLTKVLQEVLQRWGPFAKDMLKAFVI